jgi:non-ribosomal peptide synthetase component E (peptide arylation enzyme)
VILGEPNIATEAPEDRTTLDRLFRRAAVSRPHAIALADPPNRESFADGAPRRVSYAQADRTISAIATRLRRLGLPADTVVGMQLPNTVESVLTLLGVLRAGMIAAPLPLLWRRAEASAALGQIGAKAIVTASRIGEVDHGEIAMQVAAQNFPIRHVCGFGTRLADGIIPLDDLLAAPDGDPPPPLDRAGNPAEHVALVAFDVAPDAPIAVARSHRELIAGGRATVLAGRLPSDATVLGCVATHSFAGLALTVLPWLICGGRLCLHHGFDAEALAAQIRDERCDTAVVPGALSPLLLSAGLLDQAELKTVLALWRAPERLSTSPPWRHAVATLIDMLAFGETAVIACPRAPDGRPAALPARRLHAPQGDPDAAVVAELARTDAGTLAVRGPMVPRAAFPPGAERRADAAGFVDTLYPCRLDQAGERLVVTAPPPGIVSVGGCRFVLRELQELVRHADADASITALPDSICGHRLAGSAGDSARLREALAAAGANSLVVDAFTERKPEAA